MYWFHGNNNSKEHWLKNVYCKYGYVGEHKKGLHIRNFDIISDSQAATKALDSLQINSKVA